MSAGRLTKSLLLEGARCPKALWLAMNRPAAAVPADAAAAARRREGQRVGEYARQFVPGGTLIAAPSSATAEALARTRRALDAGAAVLYEPAFEHEGVFVRVDILRRDAGDSWSLIEVKASTRVKDEQLLDVAIQRWVVEGAGLRVGRAAVLVVNGEYVRAGPLDVSSLFALHDCSEETASLAPAVAASVQSLGALAAGASEPDAEIGTRCRTPHPCAFTDVCWDEVPDGSIYEVAHLGDEACSALRAMGILLPRDIPPEFDVPRRAQRAVAAARAGRERLDRAAVRALLASLEHPVRFLDFEAIGPAIPPFDGTRPYDVIPFQFSVHVEEREGAPVRHGGVVGDPTTDFRASLAASLADALGDDGTILHWTSYELRCIERLAAAAEPGVAARLRRALERLTDLAEPFRAGVVVLPETLGSYSVKRILPALVPSLSYADLEIADGLAASRAFESMMDRDASAATRAEQRARLEAYCERDTLAMVEILAALRRRADTPGDDDAR